jgi:hypothetical protein
MKTLLASAVALSLFAGAASARTVFDRLNETAPHAAVFTQINETAPKSAFDRLNETAPRSDDVFTQINEQAPRSADELARQAP